MNDTIEGRAAQIAAELFGVSGAARQLDGESDLNFLIETEAGERHVLKLHHPATDTAVLDMQDRALNHLAASELTLATPRPRPSLDGHLIARAAWSDGERPARLLSWIEGRPWVAETATPELLELLGRRLGELDRALEQFSHPEEGRADLLWRITAAGEVAVLTAEVDADLRLQVEKVFARFEHEVVPQLAGLPAQVVHHDVNENNIVLDDKGEIAGLIDFGDVVRVPRIAELAVAAAYAAQGFADPTDAFLPLVAGYHATNPLLAAELAVFVDLVKVRLATSVTMAAHQYRQAPDNEYLLISQTGVRPALLVLADADPDLIHFRLRDALGFEASPVARQVRQFFESGEARPVPVVRDIDRLGQELGHGFGAVVPGASETVYVNRGIPVLPGVPVRAPLDGTVAAVGRDWIVLGHRTGDDVGFGIAVGGLDFGGARPTPGDRVHAADQLGTAAPTTRPDWAVDEFPLGVVRIQLQSRQPDSGAVLVDGAPLEDFDVWRSLLPDPNLLIGDPEPPRRRPPRSDSRLIQRRRTNFSTALGLSYAAPVHVVRGEGAHLFDRDGNRWLDLVNNVCHVGHAHPRVVAAAHTQAAVLNTNTRYVHESAVEYARRLVELFPDPLHVCFLVNSGSEANDLALRLARTHTGATDALVLDHAYHGNLTSQIDLSPYKFNRAGGAGQPPGTWVCELPDKYRGRHRDVPIADQGQRYAESVAEQLGRLRAAGRSPAAFYVESLQSCGGQIVLPEGYLPSSFALARAAGAVTVADEIQVGLGRVGRHVWGFELQGVVPDIVTLGKPLGNGHPLAAVVTTPEIARSFANGMEWFNTFGGNPVSAEVGLAVLDVVRDEGLQANARARGDQLKEGLRQASAGHPVIGDVRGEGLFIGIELSLDDRLPATAHAHALKEGIKARGAMVSTDGPDDNVIKIKPPMVLTSADCDWFVEVFEEALTEVEKAMG